MLDRNKQVSRRNFLKTGAAGAAALIGGALLNPGSLLGKIASAESHNDHDAHATHKSKDTGTGSHGMQHGYDPGTEKTDGFMMAKQALSNFDYGKVSKSADGRTIREYEMTALEKEIEIMKGIMYPGWTYTARFLDQRSVARKGIL